MQEVIGFLWKEKKKKKRGVRRKKIGRGGKGSASKGKKEEGNKWICEMRKKDGDGC